MGKKARRALVTEAPAPLIDRPSTVIFRREGALERPTFTHSGGGAGERLVLGVDVVYACVRTIADAISGAQVNEWRGIDPLPPSRLTRRPMQRLTMREWLWKVASTLALYNVCPLISRGGEDSEGVPWSVVPVSPARLQWPVDGQPLLDGTPIIPRFGPPDPARDVPLAHDGAGVAAAAGAGRLPRSRRGADLRGGLVGGRRRAADHALLPTRT